MKQNITPDWVFNGESGDGHTIIERISWWNAIQSGERWNKILGESNGKS